MSLRRSIFGTLIYHIRTIPEDMEEKRDPVPAMAISASNNIIRATHASEEADSTDHSIYSFLSTRKADISPTTFQIRL